MRMEPIASIRGRVVHGKGLGHTVGMPTANTSLIGSLPLGEGVYASYVYIDGKRYIGVTNIGHRPTVDADDRITVETTIIGFDEDIYGKEIELGIMCFLRPTIKMESLEKVKAQVDIDKARAVDLLG